MATKPTAFIVLLVTLPLVLTDCSEVSDDPSESVTQTVTSSVPKTPEEVVTRLDSALAAENMERAKDVVRQAGPHLILETVMGLVVKGIYARAASPYGGTQFFNVATGVAAVYAEASDTPDMVELVQHYSKYTQERCRERLKAMDLFYAGAAILRAGQVDEAAATIDKALATFDSIGDSLGSSSTMSILGTLYGEQRLFVKASETLNESLEIARKVGAPTIEAVCLLALGLVEKEMFHRDKAVTSYHVASNIFEKAGYQQGVAFAKRAIGEVLSDVGDYSGAREYFLESYDISLGIRDSCSAAKHLLAAAGASASMFEYSEALRQAHMVLDLSSGCSDSVATVDALMTLGQLHDRLNRFDLARVYFDKAGILMPSKQDERMARLLCCYGDLFAAQHQDSSAFDHYNEARIVFEANSNMGGQLYVERAVGALQCERQQFDSAISTFQRMHQLATEHNYSLAELLSLGRLGDCFYHKGEYDRSVELHRQVVDRAAPLSDPHLRAYSRRVLANSLWKSARLDEAESMYRMSADSLELIYSARRSGMDYERTGYHIMAGELYREWALLLADLGSAYPRRGYYAEALQISDQAKSRRFSELLAMSASGRVHAGNQTLSSMRDNYFSLKRQYQLFQEHLQYELYKPDSVVSADVVVSLSGQCSNIQDSLVQLETELEAKFPLQSLMNQGNVVSSDTLQRILGVDEAMVSYLIGKKQTIAFVITDSEFHLVSSLPGRDSLKAAVQRFREGLHNVSDTLDLLAFDPRVAYSIYQEIFEPIEAHLDGKDRLYICADEYLYTLPFEALVCEDPVAWPDRADSLGSFQGLSYLVDRFVCSYLPTVNTLAVLRQQALSERRNWRIPIVGFANPDFASQTSYADRTTNRIDATDTGIRLEILREGSGHVRFSQLPNAEQSARQVFALFEGREQDLFVGKDATEENLYSSSLSDAKYALFATHGFVSSDFGGCAEPALVLSLADNPPGTDGFLSMTEVTGLDLKCQMVALSSCNTYGELDTANTGEGFIGLSRAFLCAGAKSVMASFWSVENLSAMDLTERTFRHIKGGMDRSLALRTAKVEIKDSKGMLWADEPSIQVSRAHPYFWAPFILVGEP